MASFSTVQSFMLLTKSAEWIHKWLCYINLASFKAKLWYSEDETKNPI